MLGELQRRRSTDEGAEPGTVRRTAARPAGAGPHRPVLNLAHRGASAHAPEHTFAAYDLALRLGAGSIEPDVQLTRDGVLVAFHDETLDRTARGPARTCTGRVRDKTLAQLKTCDVGSWFNDAFPERARPDYVGLRIPTLDEVFRRYGHRTSYCIEIKSPETADRMEERLVALIDRHGLCGPPARNGRALVQSFSQPSLEHLRGLAPFLPLFQLYFEHETSETIRAGLDAAATYALGIGPAKADVDRPLVEAAHARGLEVHPYTVNESREMRALVDAGVDGMFTDFPDRLDAVLRRGRDRRQACGEADRREPAGRAPPLPARSGLASSPLP